MITAILTCYRRPQHLQLQIDAIRKQSVDVEDIWIWKNYHEDNANFNYKDLGCKVFDCNHNWKYCGRFAAACLVDTPYTAIFDDDTIPGPKWFENCLREHENHPGIYGGVGVKLLTNNSYQPNKRFGWVSQNKETVEVDLVGHAWFFPAHYIKHMWQEKPIWANGEDMHFSAMCQIHGGIHTYVPPHPITERPLWSSLHGVNLGLDSVASSSPNRHQQFYLERNKCVQRLVELGWKVQCC